MEATMVQAMPRGRGADIARLVEADLEARVEMGRVQYGERLRAHNGRDAMVDALQEGYDLVLYLKQCEVEQQWVNAQLQGLRAQLAASQSLGREDIVEIVALLSCILDRSIVPSVE
jgi:hypothetical protein